MNQSKALECLRMMLFLGIVGERDQRGGFFPVRIRDLGRALGVGLTPRRLLDTGRPEKWPMSLNALNPVSLSAFLAYLMRWL